MPEDDHGKMYGRFLRDTSLQVAYRRVLETLCASPFSWKGQVQQDKEGSMTAVLPDGSKVPGSYMDILPCGRDNRFVETVFADRRRIILSDQGNMVRVFVLGPEQNEDARYVTTHSEKYSRNMIESSPNNKIPAKAYENKIMELFSSHSPSYSPTEDIDIDLDLEGMSEDVDLSDLDEVDDAFDDIEIDVVEEPDYETLMARELENRIIKHFSEPYKTESCKAEPCEAEDRQQKSPANDDTELYIPPIDPRLEEMTELVDESIGGLRKVNLANEDGVKEMFSYETVKAAMAACAAANLDELCALEYDRLAIIGKGFVLDLPRHPDIHDREPDDEEENRLISALYRIPGAADASPDMKYRLEQGMLSLGSRYLQMLEFLEKNEGDVLLYSTSPRIKTEDIFDHALPDKGSTAIYSKDPETTERIALRAFSMLKDLQGSSMDSDTQSLKLGSRELYFIGSESREAFDQGALQATAEKLMMSGTEETAPVHAPTAAEESRAIPEEKPDSPEEPDAMTVREMQPGKDTEADEFDELFKKDNEEGAIILTKKGDGSRYKARMSTPEDEFRKTFPDGNVVIVLEQWKKEKAKEAGNEK